MDEIEIALPYPPTVNHYWGRKHYWVRDEKGKLKVVCRNFIKKKGIDFHNEVRKRFFIKGVKKCYLNAIYLKIYIYPPDKRLRDSDNILKALFDSLEKSKIIKNDNQVGAYMVIRKEVKRPKGEVIIKIKDFIEEF